jgi:hypothetical protein
MYKTMKLINEEGGRLQMLPIILKNSQEFMETTELGAEIA